MGWETLPALNPILQGIQNLRPSTAYGDNPWNRIFDSFGTGGASNATFYNPAIMQAGAKGRAVEEGKGLGEVGKESAAGGGEQWNVVDKAKSIGRENVGAQAGTAGATAQGTAEGTQYNQARQKEQNDFTLQKAKDYFGLLKSGSHYQQSPWASFLPNLLSGAASGLMGMGFGALSGGGEPSVSGGYADAPMPTDMGPPGVDMPGDTAGWQPGGGIG